MCLSNVCDIAQTMIIKKSTAIKPKTETKTELQKELQERNESLARATTRA